MWRRGTLEVSIVHTEREACAKAKVFIEIKIIIRIIRNPFGFAISALLSFSVTFDISDLLWMDILSFKRLNGKF